MSRHFLTRAQAGQKLGKNLTGDGFITKQEAIAAGAEESKLVTYSHFEYIVDDDISGASSWGNVFIHFESKLPGTEGSDFCAEVTIYYTPL